MQPIVVEGVVSGSEFEIEDQGRKGQGNWRDGDEYCLSQSMYFGRVWRSRAKVEEKEGNNRFRGKILKGHDPTFSGMQI